MASIRKRGSRWQVQVRRRGYAALSRSFGRKADALTWSRQMEAEVDRRGLPADPKTLENVSLGDVIRRYRDTVVAGKRSRDVETVILNAFLRTEVAALPLARLTPARLAQYRDTRLQVVKPATINRELGVIQHALDLARREWDVPLWDNPVRQVRRPRLGHPRDRRLRSGELGRLLDACMACRNPYIEPLVRLAIE